MTVYLRRYRFRTFEILGSRSRPESTMLVAEVPHKTPLIPVVHNLLELSVSALTTPPFYFRRFVIGCATRHPVLLPVVRGSRHCIHETPEKKCLAPLPGATNRATSALSADLRALAAYAIRNRPYRARRVCLRHILARRWLTLTSDEDVVR